MPYFPSRNPRFGRYARLASVPATELRAGLKVTYPRYPLLPKVSMSAAPWLLAAATLRHLRGIQRGGFDFDLIDAYYLYPDGVAAAALARILQQAAAADRIW